MQVKQETFGNYDTDGNNPKKEGIKFIFSSMAVFLEWQWLSQNKYLSGSCSAGYISDHISNLASFALDIIISDSGELLKEFYLSEATGDFKGWAFPISLWTKGNQRLRLPQTTQTWLLDFLLWTEILDLQSSLFQNRPAQLLKNFSVEKTWETE